MYFILRPYFVQNKYVPRINNSPPPRGPTAPHGRCAPQFVNRASTLFTVTYHCHYHHIQFRGIVANVMFPTKLQLFVINPFLFRASNLPVNLLV
jgi:hypothetical protein